MKNKGTGTQKKVGGSNYTKNDKKLRGGLKNGGRVENKAAKEKEKRIETITGEVLARIEDGGAVELLTPDKEEQKELASLSYLFSLPKCNLSDPNDVINRTLTYLNTCISNNIKPTVAAYSLSLNLSQQNLKNLVFQGQTKLPHLGIISCPPQSQLVLSRALDFINASYEQYLVEGKSNPISSIFLLKNHFGYSDKVEVVGIQNNAPKQTEQELLDEVKMLQKGLKKGYENR